MRAVVQRVKKASVTIDSHVNTIGQGFVVFLGVEKDDTVKECEYLAKKISNLRIFNDSDGRMKESLAQIDGEILSISQFTLLADVAKGNRPNFTKAEEPVRAKKLYDEFNKLLEENLGKEIKTGKFGADMQVELINDGPVTILYDTKNK